MIPPTGPFAVGCRDFTWRLGTAPADATNNLAGRLFYPAAPGAKGGGRATWIKHWMYAKGYVQFAFFSARSLKWRMTKAALQATVWAAGAGIRLPVSYDAPPAPPRPDPFPLVVFSPGAAANRNTYSSVCAELASRGCFVAAVEHADGSSGAAQLADGSWRLFAGLGTGPVLEAKCDYRAAEVLTAVRLLRAVNEGSAPEGAFWVSGCDASGGGLDVFKGAMDLSKLTIAGHSCGGATAALVASRCPEVAAAVALDPWWPILPAGSPALTQWLPGCTAPLQIIGSDDWNTPKADGTLACGGARQKAVLEAARNRPGGGGAGGGALLLVPAHTKHHSFSDVPALIEDSALARSLLSAMGFKPQPVPAAAALRLICDCAARFCRAHYAAGGAWPAAGGAAEDTAEAAAAAGAAAAAAGGGGHGTAAGAGGGGDDEEGMATDEDKECTAEAHMREADGRRPAAQNGAAAAPSGGGSAAAGGAAGAPAGAGAVPHVRVRAGDKAAYSKLFEEGLLKTLEVYE
ncbi:MAG: platelet-activating factor acetylhydrolase, isoform II-domain-containing protein [Monoraphidium minutum]|nr:MAG: platelet-activating factor acetylhydrolase, isoform II-domain-containing protein [Monoraphidium minutum]